MSKKLILIGWIFLMLVVFYFSYFGNVARVDGVDLKTGKDVGGLTITRNNIALMLLAVSVAYMIILVFLKRRKKLKKNI